MQEDKIADMIVKILHIIVGFSISFAIFGVYLVVLCLGAAAVVGVLVLSYLYLEIALPIAAILMLIACCKKKWRQAIFN